MWNTCLFRLKTICGPLKLCLCDLFWCKNTCFWRIFTKIGVFGLFLGRFQWNFGHFLWKKVCYRVLTPNQTCFKQQKSLFQHFKVFGFFRWVMTLWKKRQKTENTENGQNWLQRWVLVKMGEKKWSDVFLPKKNRFLSKKHVVSGFFLKYPSFSLGAQFLISQICLLY